MANGHERTGDWHTATRSGFIAETSELVAFESAKSNQVSAENYYPSSAMLQCEDAISTVARATPSSTSTEVFVPRRRFQRGRLFVRGSRKKVWVGSFREDQVQPDGSITRIRRSVVLGETARVSRRAALATLQPFLDRVNIAPPPLPKSGKTLLEAVADWRIHIAPNLKPSTVRAAESHLKQHIIPHLGTLRLSEFTVKVVQAFSTGLISGRTRKTVENILQTLFSILQTARQVWQRRSLRFRARTSCYQAEASNREVRFFDAAQVGQIIAAAKEPFSTMFAVLGMTGFASGGDVGTEGVGPGLYT